MCRLSRTFWLLGLVLACGLVTAWAGPAAAPAEPVDASVQGDLAAATDRAATTDLAGATDFAAATDLAVAADVPGSVEVSESADLVARADLAAEGDAGGGPSCRPPNPARPWPTARWPRPATWRPARPTPAAWSSPPMPPPAATPTPAPPATTAWPEPAWPPAPRRATTATPAPWTFANPPAAAYIWPRPRRLTVTMVTPVRSTTVALAAPASRVSTPASARPAPIARMTATCATACPIATRPRCRSCASSTRRRW